MTLLEVSALTKRFGGLVANEDVSFTVDAGEIVGLIGPNGAGKTTLFNSLAGFFAPTSGTTRLGSLPLGHRTDKRPVEQGEDRSLPLPFPRP